jgi:hypothetical protein
VGAAVAKEFREPEDIASSLAAMQNGLPQFIVRRLMCEALARLATPQTGAGRAQAGRTGCSGAIQG